jgi:hypothetical protein
MSFVRFNAHPENKIVGDCVKRAISKAFNADYKEVSLLLNRHKKVSGSKNFNQDQNWKSFIETLGVEKISFPAVKGYPRMNGRTFCESFPKGRYILQMANHVSVCIDGVIYDTWDCRQRCVYLAFKVLNTVSDKEVKGWVRI